MADNKISNQLFEASVALLKSGVVAFPTETVMGLGVIFDDEKAYNKLNQVKNRPEDKPYTLMLGDVNSISYYAEVDRVAQAMIDKFMPGPITLLLKAKPTVPGYVTHYTGLIGIRVPNNEIAQKLIKGTGKGLLVPSANKSGEKPLMNSEEVKEIFKDELDYIIDGKAGGEAPSTLVEFEGRKFKIHREGPITSKMIEEVLIEKFGYMTKVILGSDHGGFEYKQRLMFHLLSKGYDVYDGGTYTLDSTDYPIYGEHVGRFVASGNADFGIVICTSGEGIMMAANKAGARCGIGYNDDVARLMREHNDANVIAFGQKFMSYEDVERRVDIFLNTPFEGGRHQRRVDILNKIK